MAWFTDQVDKYSQDEPRETTQDELAQWQSQHEPDIEQPDFDSQSDWSDWQ
jgi:hypothetical protein